MSGIWEDIRYAIRTLGRSPRFTTVALITLALGIGANLAIFQLVDAVRVRSLPVANAARLVQIHIANTEGIRGMNNTPYPSLSYPLWEQLRQRQQALADVFAWSPGEMNLASGGEARWASAILVSGNFFDAVGVRPIMGRGFSADDDSQSCGSPRAVLSYEFWQREFSGDPDILGRKIQLERYPYKIIGVAPRNFTGLEVGKHFDVAVPFCADNLPPGDSNRLQSGVNWWVIVMGHRKPGWSMEKTSASLEAISPGLFEATVAPNYPRVSVPKYLGFKLAAYPAGTGVSTLREDYSNALFLLMGVAGLALLIACANLANLILARLSAREREMAVRRALGASSGRLIRQLVTESLLLAFAGALAGIWLAQWLSELLVGFISTEGDPLFLDLKPDWRLLAFAAGTAALTCVLFGVIPALQAVHGNPDEVLKGRGQGGLGSRAGLGLRRLLVASQLSLSLVLLVGAFLFTSSFRNLIEVDSGFRKDEILISNMDMSRANLPVEKRAQFKNELIKQLEDIPGVSGAAETSVVPLSGTRWDNNVWMDGSDSTHQKQSWMSAVSPGYFRMMDIALDAGRDFNQHDGVNSPKVAIVNEAFAREYVRGANPIGKRFWREATTREPQEVFEIVGLVKNTKYESLRQEYEPIVYLPTSQDALPDTFARIMIRSKATPAALISSVQAVVGKMSPEIVTTFQPLQTMIRDSLMRESLMATLSDFFGVLAMMLVALGVYGVTSFAVVRRTNEIGIRMALGARRSDVLKLILRETVVLLAVGLTVGTVFAVVLAKGASALLYGLKAGDPLSFVVAVVFLAVVALGASYAPAQRAAKLDPMVALRDE